MMFAALALVPAIAPLQMDEVNLSVQLLDDLFRPLPGIPVEVLSPAIGPVSLSTESSGQAPFVVVEGGLASLLTVAETATPDGLVIGQTRVVDVDPSSVHENQVDIIGVPLARPVLVQGSRAQATSFGPGDLLPDWWAFQVPAGVQHDFRARVAPLLSDEVIDAALGYLGYGPAPYSYVMGAYIESEDVNFGTESLFLQLNALDHRIIPTDAVVDTFIFRDGAGWTSTLKVSVVGVETVYGSAGVRLDGIKPRGKTLVLLRSGSAGPPITFLGDDLGQVIVSEPIVNGQLSAGCKPCQLGKWETETQTGVSYNDCVVDTQDIVNWCPDSFQWTGPAKCHWRYTEATPAVCDPGGGSLNLGSGISRSVTVSVNVTFQGVGFQAGSTVNISGSIGSNTPFDQGECECGQCKQIVLYTKICTRPWESMKHDNFATDDWGSFDYCATEDKGVAHCGVTVLQYTHWCDQVREGCAGDGDGASFPPPGAGGE